MVLKIYGSSYSTCAQRVALICHEKKIPFELFIVDMKTGEHKSATYLEKQPFGQIPYIDDDGFILFESRAICRYLCAKYPDQGTSLVPKDPKALALVEQGVSIESSNFDFHVSSIVAERYFKPMRGLTTNEEFVSDRLAILKTRLAGYEAILGKQKYIAGDELTLADLFHIPYGELLPKAGSDILVNESFPNVSRWWKDITSRPTWKKVQAGLESVPSYD
ncbi:glutathione S-transferase-like protein [Pluteus cervinus]|uniref:Glutathione S-transferase-like protein n=1 Tax=Pluteus cervinus TaxID=181527 RepID=A0ACD3AI56_9AGAR|nr:glutathione S-transferase-like protein [Pluteus cervinus]